MSRTILPYLQQINKEYRVILASASPRRKELLSLIGITNYEIQVSSFAENLDKSTFTSAEEYCRNTAEEKVKDVCRNLDLGSLDKKTIVIGADTIVAINGMILEKPVDEDDAFRMISLLNGQEHEVHTAVVLFSNFHSNNSNNSNPSPARHSPLMKFTSIIETTKVRFSHLQEQDIIAYVQSGEGRDKAGSYGIQGLGGQLVEKVDGCYFNVMGLPIHVLSRELALLLREE
jgi:septum formation protein